MKNLATCNLYEFMAQTNRIRHSVSDWLKLVDLKGIRSKKIDFPEGATKEERDKIVSDTAGENINLMLEAALEKHPRETAEIIALCCFIDPADIPNYQSREFMGAFADMIGDTEVLRFFGSLMKLAQMAGLME